MFQIGEKITVTVEKIAEREKDHLRSGKRIKKTFAGGEKDQLKSGKKTKKIKSYCRRRQKSPS